MEEQLAALEEKLAAYEQRLQAIEAELRALKAELSRRPAFGCTWPEESYEFHLTHPSLWMPLKVS